MKYFKMSKDEVLWGHSYLNLHLYIAFQSSDLDKGKDKKVEEEKSAEEKKLSDLEKIFGIPVKK